MSGISVDSFVTVEPDCPITAQVNVADETVEVVLGTQLGRQAVRLVLPDVDTCNRLAEVARQARNMLVETTYERLPEPDEYDEPPAQRDPRRLAVVGGV